MTEILREIPGGRIAGVCDPQFNAVLEEFTTNFVSRQEVGASVCLAIDGEIKVDLWGGLANNRTGQVWDRDTIGIVFSCTKAATALCAHVLVSRGLLDLDAPVSTYWPEFAAAGKDKATVSMLLDHSVGLPAFREPVKADAAYDWDYMASRLAAEAPFWEPGTRNGYHAITFGWTVGEVVRRVSGKSLGKFFEDEIAKPLGADFWIGLPEALEPRVAPMIPAQGPGPGEEISDAGKLMFGDPTSVTHLAFFNVGSFGTGGFNTREGHAAEIGGGGGISNARGLCKMYAPLACGGRLHDVQLVDRTTLARMSRISMATHTDAVLLMPSRFALGFMKSMDNRKEPAGRRDSAIMGEDAFGHVGAGGSIGFADPDCGLSFGYTMNRMGAGILLNARGQSLVDAAYRSVGFSTCDGGAWRP